MTEVKPDGFWACAGICVLGCGAGCWGCIDDGPVVIMDSVTGGPAFFSGAGTGAYK